MNIIDWMSVYLKNLRAQVLSLLCACRSLAFHFRFISGSLLVHFRFTSGSLPVHLGPIDGHMRCPIIQFYKKMNFPKFVHKQTHGKKSNS